MSSGNIDSGSNQNVWIGKIMALNKLKFNSINVTPAASEAIRFNSGANGFETASAGGNMALIKTQTASSSASISFVDGTSDVVLDSTYKEYIFLFNNIHPSKCSPDFQFNFSTDSGSVTIMLLKQLLLSAVSLQKMIVLTVY